jgi:peptidoglycan/xylan/chitin deacetylase (PgdA/CDA1 family)
MYHRFPSDTEGLTRQCEHILRYYEPISLSTISRSLQEKQPFPENSLAITVDDGYRDFFLHAYPVFRKYKIPATVFLVSDFIDQRVWLWWNQIEYLFRNTSQASVTVHLPNQPVRDYALASDEQKTLASQRIINCLVTVENDQRLEVLDSLNKLLNVELPALPEPMYSALKWDEVREMAGEGIEFGAHTRTHPILSRIADTQILEEEIKGSKLRIEEQLQTPVVHFCYPNGSVADFTDDTVTVVRNSGFHTAVTTERGMNLNQANPFLLRRIGVEPDGATPYFQELLAGVRVE